MTTVINQTKAQPNTTPPEGAQTYKWEELSQTAKDRAREKFIEGFTYDWWDSVYEMAKEDGLEKGFRIDDIYFSGFWSQGDGACWTGTIDVKKWLEVHAPDTIGVSAWCELVEEDYVEKCISVTHSGNYCHENTMRFTDLDFELNIDPDNASTNGFPMKNDTIFKGMEWKLLLDIVVADEACPYPNLEQIQEDIEESAKDYARHIYKQLEEEYEYLTSEEQVGEFYEANDFLFNEEGEAI